MAWPIADDEYTIRCRVCGRRISPDGVMFRAAVVEKLIQSADCSQECARTEFAVGEIVEAVHEALGR